MTSIFQTIKVEDLSDLQIIFNKVSSHLLQQNEVSRLDDSSCCAYRSSTGLKCAVGCLITDENYSPELEKALFSHSKIMTALEKSGVKCSNDNLKKLLGELQYMHDFRHPSGWKIILKEIAQKFNLNSEEIAE